jgi:prevent-host-death family protein
MTKVSAAEARNEFSEILNRTSFGKERIVLTRRGKDLAALVPMEDLELLERLEDRIDLEDARAALAEVREGGTVSWEKLKSDLGL